MQNKILDKINTSVKIMCLVLLILCICVVKSIYLLISFTLLFIILFMLTEKSVKFYINSFKNIKTWLLIIFITYIIVFGNILNILILIYKTILIVLFIKQVDLTITFEKLNNGIKTILKPFNKLNIDKVSYNITLYIYFLKIYINSKKEIFNNYHKNKKIYYNFSIKYNVLPRIFFTISKINELESKLKLKFYKPKYEEQDRLSKTILVCSALFFIVVIFKEVIL